MRLQLFFNNILILAIRMMSRIKIIMSTLNQSNLSCQVHNTDLCMADQKLV
jgi:hypothetical protein